jgi:hypothetical protein
LLLSAKVESQFVLHTIVAGIADIPDGTVCLKVEQDETHILFKENTGQKSTL